MHPTVEQEARMKAIRAATKPLKEQIDRLWAILIVIHPEIRGDIFKFKDGEIHNIKLPDNKNGPEGILEELLKASRAAAGELLKYQSTSRDTTRVNIKLQQVIAKVEEKLND